MATIGTIDDFAKLLRKAGLGESKMIEDAYKRSVWVYSCLNKIVQGVLSVPFQVLDKSGKEPIEDDFHKLLHNANPVQNDIDKLWSAHTMYMGLRGECIWLLDPVDDGTANINPRPLRQGELPQEIWIIDPNRFEAITYSPSNPVIKEWHMRYSGGVLVIPPENIVQFKTFNPDSLHRGLSPLRVLARSLIADEKAISYNTDLLDNNAEPRGVIMMDDDLPQAEADALIKRWEDKHDRSGKRKRVGILTGGARYQSFALSPEDMQFIALRTFTIDEVCAVYSVPKTKALGFFEGSTFSNMDAADEAFWTECMLSKLMSWPNTINGRFGVTTRFDLSNVDALIRILIKKASGAKTLLGLGYTINQVNDRLNLGMPEVPWGDIPLSLIGSISGDSSSDPAADNTDSSKYISAKQLVQLINTDCRAKSGPFVRTPKSDRRVKNLHLSKANELYITRNIEEQERAFLGVYRHYVDDLWREQLERIDDASGKRARSKTLDVDSVLVPENKWRELLANKTSAVRIRTVEDSLQLIAEELGSEILSLSDPRVVAILKAKEIKVKAITNTLRSRIRFVISNGVKDSKSVEQIKSDLRALKGFEKVSPSRALTIARTETAQAASGARYSAMKAEGVISKEWSTAADEVVRSDHNLFEALGAKLERFDYLTAATLTEGGSQLFYPSDMLGPPSQIINCRCSIHAVD